jgi:hypothetical protein
MPGQVNEKDGLSGFASSKSAYYAPASSSPSGNAAGSRSRGFPSSSVRACTVSFGPRTNDTGQLVLPDRCRLGLVETGTPKNTSRGQTIGHDCRPALFALLWSVPGDHYSCALMSTDTIYSCCSAVISANSGSERILRAERSATGNAPSL